MTLTGVDVGVAVGVGLGFTVGVGVGETGVALGVAVGDGCSGGFEPPLLTLSFENRKYPSVPSDSNATKIEAIVTGTSNDLRSSVITGGVGICCIGQICPVGTGAGSDSVRIGSLN